MEYLSDKAVGESTFHPSSRGSSYLSLTIKIYDGVYAHKEITEGGKDQKDAMSLLHLGKTLKIGDENFEDLDEGFKFRKHTFDNIDRLVAYFQKHINDPWPEKAPSIQSVVAMVPMKSPAFGAPTGGGWESNTGGWRGQFNSSRDKTCTPSSRGKSTN
ncbi:hypothetical protein AAG906_033349 [Vitis piasezkii]